MVTQKEIFYQYLLNERDRLEADVVQLRQSLRYKANVDAVDCLELSLALERLNSFVDYSNHAIAIFKLSIPRTVTPFVWGALFYAFAHKLTEHKNRAQPALEAYQPGARCIL